VGVVQVKNMS